MGKKAFKTLLITVGALLCFSSIAGAEYIDSVNYNYTTNKVEISGKDFDDYNGQYATVMVVTQGSNISSLAAANITKQAEVLIEDGKFNLEFSLKSTSTANYTAYIKAGSITRMSDFSYNSGITTIYNTIMGKTTDTEFANAISSNAAALVLNDTVYNSVDKAQAGAIAYADKASVTNVEELKEAVIRAAIIQAFNESDISAVVQGTSFIDADILGLEDLSETAYTLYTTQMTEAGQKKVLANLQGQDFETSEEFLDAFVYEATIAAIKYSTLSGTAHIQAILEDNNSRNKLDLSNYKNDETNTIDLALLQGKEWSKDDIQAVLDEEISDDGQDPETNSGGNSGSKPSSNGGNSGISLPSVGTITSTEPTAPSDTEEQTGTFTDVTDDIAWAKPAIEALAEAGVVSGRGDGTFGPLDSVTRAEFLQMLVNALNIEVENATCEFIDVEAGAWYYNAVATGTTFGLASGYGNGYFGTTDLITRQDAAVMLNNAVTTSGKELIAVNDGIDFADKLEISDYAADDVDILVKAGILSGSDGNFMPKNNCTRAEAAVMISKIMTAIGLEG